MAIVERIVERVGDRQAARWDRFGGPSRALRWSMHHPWWVTVGVAVPLAVVLAAAFGVPPLSPLLLVVVLVAPIHPVLEAQRRIYERWSNGQSEIRS